MRTKCIVGISVFLLTLFSPLDNLKADEVDDLIELLSSSVSSERESAATRLGDIGNTKTIEPLVKALNDLDSNVVEAAFNALRKIGEPALQQLITAIATFDLIARNPAAVNTLAVIGQPAVEPLLNLLQNRNPNIKIFALKALGKIKNNKATAQILAQSNSIRPSVRAAAIESLAKNIDQEAQERILEALQDKALIVREKAILALGAIGGPEVIQLLTEALSHQRQRIRINAIIALGQTKDPLAVEPLIDALNDNYKIIRQTSLEALMKIQTPESFEGIRLALKDPEPNIQTTAIYALGTKNNSESIKLLAEIIKNENQENKTAAIKALQSLDNQQSVQVMSLAFEDQNPDIRISAINALGEMKNGTALNNIITALKDEHNSVKVIALNILGEKQDKRAIFPIIELLKNHHNLEGNIVKTLLRFKEKAISPVIKNLLSSNNFYLQHTAKNLLKNIGPPTVIPLLKACKSKDFDTRYSAQQLLEEIGDTQLHKFIEALSDGDVKVRRCAAEVVGKFSNNSIIEYLTWLLHDSDLGVRSGAVSSLVQLGWQPETRDLLWSLFSFYSSPHIRDLIFAHSNQYALIAILTFFFVFLIILYFSNLTKKKNNSLSELDNFKLDKNEIALQNVCALIAIILWGLFLGLSSYFWIAKITPHNYLSTAANWLIILTGPIFIFSETTRRSLSISVNKWFFMIVFTIISLSILKLITPLIIVLIPFDSFILLNIINLSLSFVMIIFLSLIIKDMLQKHEYILRIKVIVWTLFFLNTANLILTIVYLNLEVTLNSLIISLFEIIIAFLLGIETINRFRKALLDRKCIRVTSKQFLPIHQAILAASIDMGIYEVPKCYICSAGGIYNTILKYLNSEIIILTTKMAELIGNKEDEDILKATVRNKIAHVKLIHHQFSLLLLPALIIPFLYQAYKRSCEFSADLLMLEFIPKAIAINSLLLFSIENRFYKSINVDEVIKQAEESHGFWYTLYELISFKPYLLNRIYNLSKTGTQ